MLGVWVVAPRHTQVLERMRSAGTALEEPGCAPLPFARGTWTVPRAGLWFHPGQSWLELTTLEGATGQIELCCGQPEVQALSLPPYLYFGGGAYNITGGSLLAFAPSWSSWDEDSVGLGSLGWGT